MCFFPPVLEGASAPLLCGRSADIVFISLGRTSPPVAIATVMREHVRSGSEKICFPFLLVDVGRRCEVWLSAGVRRRRGGGQTALVGLENNISLKLQRNYFLVSADTTVTVLFLLHFAMKLPMLLFLSQVSLQPHLHYKYILGRKS